VRWVTRSWLYGENLVGRDTIWTEWENGDSRSHALIASKIKSEFDVWQVGTKTYY
jgi:hypothetical protein